MKRSLSSSTSKQLKRNKLHHRDRENRMSQLPDPILHNILSFLPTKDATKTSVLSKLWNSLWNSFPVLDFNQDDHFKKSVQEFCKYVNDSIKRHRTDVCVQGFKLAVRFNNTGLKSRWEDLERWINYAVSNNVQHLVLRYYKHKTSKKAWPYPLPMSSAIFHATSLTELDLFGCKFVESGLYQFPFSLKKLTLEHVDINDQTLQSLLSNCGSLEELTIKQCSGFQSVKLSSNKLETVDLYLKRSEVQTVAIEAPNLRSLSYGGDCANVINSLEASNFNKNLAELKFHSGITITDAIINRVTHKFRFLEKLKLVSCSFPGNIRHSDLLNCYNQKNPTDIPPGMYKLGDQLLS